MESQTFVEKKYSADFEVIAEREFEVEETVLGRPYQVRRCFKSKTSEAKIKENVLKVSKPKNKTSKKDIPIGFIKGEKKLSTKNLL